MSAAREHGERCQGGLLPLWACTLGSSPHQPRFDCAVPWYLRAHPAIFTPSPGPGGPHLTHLFPPSVPAFASIIQHKKKTALPSNQPAEPPPACAPLNSASPLLLPTLRSPPPPPTSTPAASAGVEPRAAEDGSRDGQRRGSGGDVLARRGGQAPHRQGLLDRGARQGLRRDDVPGGAPRRLRYHCHIVRCAALPACPLAYAEQGGGDPCVTSTGWPWPHNSERQHGGEQGPTARAESSACLGPHSRIAVGSPPCPGRKR